MRDLFHGSTHKKRFLYISVLLLFVSLIYGCSNRKNPTPDGKEASVTPQAEGTVQPGETPEAEGTPNTEANADSEEPYATAVPGVPEELKNDKFDLEKVLTEPSLKDAFHKYFKMGVAINGSSPDVAMVKSPELKAIAKYHFNSMTYSNLMKSAYLLDKSGCMQNAENGDRKTVAVRFDSCKPGLDFAKKNGMGMRGHVLIWHNQVPDWFFREDYDEGKAFVDKETMLARMESYIKQVLEFTQTEYPGVIYAWDVVNEAVETDPGSYDKDTDWYCRTHYDGNTENLWYTVIGSDYVEKAFEYARKYAAPDVKLFYNDYNTFEMGKSLGISNLIKTLKEKDLIDGLGMQSTYNLNYPGNMKTGYDSVKEALQRYSELGVEIHMSELTVRANGEGEFEQQAKRFKDFFEVVLSMDEENGGPCNITNVTFFGIMDRYLFYDGNEDDFWIFDKDLQPKPAYYSILEALQEYPR